MKLLTNRGISLINVMIASALLAGLSLTVMRVMKNIGEGQNFVKNAQDQIELRSEIRMILNDERYCRVSLAGDGPQGAPTSPVTFFKTQVDEENNAAEGLDVELFLSNQAGDTRTRNKVSATDPIGSKYGKLTISSLKLFMNNGVGSNYPDSLIDSDYGELHLVVSKKSSSNEREIKMVFAVKVGFKTTGGESTILSCAQKVETITNPLKCYSLRRYEEVNYNKGFLNDTGDVLATVDSLVYTDIITDYGGITAGGVEIANTGLTNDAIAMPGGVNDYYGMKCNDANGFFMMSCVHASADDNGDSDVIFVNNGCFAGDNDGTRKRSTLDMRCCRYE